MPSTNREVFEEALDNGQFGLAVIDENLIVKSRLGALSAWAPPAGTPACDAPLLTHMEENFAELRARGGEMALPSVRASAAAPRVTITISWRPSSKRFIAVTTRDHAGEQIERLMASDRREKQILRQQADAAAARLRVADALYRDIVESSDNLVLRFGPDCRIVFANRAAAEFFGRPQDMLVGVEMASLFPSPEDAPCRLEEAAESPVSVEMSARDAKGACVWLAWDMRFLGPDAGGEFQAVARDVTAERQLRVAQEKAQEEARAAAVARERLRIAHDLHDTLVRSIVTMIAEARLIAKQTSDPEARAALAEFDAQARQGLREAREAIAQTRAARQDVDLRAIATQFQARARDVQVTLAFADDAPLVPETAALFAAVLQEALRNIELHAGAKRVRIAVSAGEEGARLEVADDGAGFDPQAPAQGHFGVAGMRERAALAGAQFAIESAPGEGTRIMLVAPRQR